MKEMESSSPQKGVFSSSLTEKSEPPLASRPIFINKASSSSKKPHQIAASCPTFSTVPPPAPSAKPKVPNRDPPTLMLPPSPPVFSPMQAQAAEAQLKQVKKQVMARSLTNYSSSLPDVSWLQMQMQGSGGQMPSFPSINEALPQPIVNSSNRSSSSNNQLQPPNTMESDLDGHELGKSPTIFSLLQGTSAPSSRATSFVNNSGSFMGGPSGSLLGTSLQNPSSRASGKSNVHIYDNGPDVPEDDLLFSISLDQHENDSYLADSARDYLHM